MNDNPRLSTNLEGHVGAWQNKTGTFKEPLCRMKTWQSGTTRRDSIHSLPGQNFHGNPARYYSRRLRSDPTAVINLLSGLLAMLTAKVVMAFAQFANASWC